MNERFQVTPAVYVIFRREDTVLLLRRANTAYMNGMYSLPAGHLEGDETAEQAAVRESKEEVGVSIALEDLQFKHVMHRKSVGHERIDLFFEADKWTGEPKNTEPDKCDDLAWFSLANLPENTVPEVKYALGCVAAGSVYSNYNF